MYGITSSDVLITYFNIDECDYFTGDELSGFLNDAIPANSGVSAAYIAPKYYQGEVNSQTIDARDHTLYAMLFSFLLLCFLVRGIIVPMMTFFCIWFSMVNAASILNYCHYSYISVFDSAGMIVLSSTGIAWVALYGSQWRTFVDKAGKF